MTDRTRDREREREWERQREIIGEVKENKIQYILLYIYRERVKKSDIEKKKGKKEGGSEIKRKEGGPKWRNINR